MMQKGSNSVINIMALVVGVIGMLVPYLLPDQVFDAVPFLQDFSNRMAAIVPSIDTVSSLSQFQQVSRAYLSIMWGLWPVVVVIWVIFPGTSFSLRHVREKLLPMSLLYVVFVPAIVIFATHILGTGVSDSGSYSRVMRATGQSRFVLGIVTTVLILSVSYFVSSFVLWIRHWPVLYFGRV